MTSRYLLVALLLGAPFALAEPGALGPGDLRLDSGEYADAYEHLLDAGEEVTITLNSSEFDPYLVVLGPDDEVVLEIDDSEGQGLNVREVFTAVVTGVHVVVVTSAYADETGAYELTVGRAGGTAANPLVRAEGGLAGRYRGDGVELEIEVAAGEYRGTLTFQGRSYPLSGTAAGGSLSGSFEANGSSFPFVARLEGSSLTFETGGSSYLLVPEAASGNPLVDTASPPSANPLGGNQGPAAGVPAITRPVAGDLPAAPAETVGPGYAAGYVRSRDGRPLAGVEIRIEGVNMAGGRISAYPVTDAEGRYLTRVPDGLVRVNAYLTRDYHGQRYFIRLAPDSGGFDQEFDSSLAGINRNFTFRFAGLRPGGDPEVSSEYFGGYGTVEIGAPSCCVAEHTVPTGSGLRLTLVPEGPLLDGSQGETVVLGCDACVPDAPSYAPLWNRPALEFREVPPGQYRVSALLIHPDGSVHPARVGSHNYRDGVSSGALVQELADSVTVVFPPYNLVNGEPGVGAVTFYLDH